MERHPSQNLHPHISPRHISPLPIFPVRPPWISFAPPVSLNKDPVKRDAPFLEPTFHYLPQFSVNGLPPHVPQRHHYGERHPSAEPSTSYPLKIHLSLRVPGKEAPQSSLTGSLWTDTLLHQSLWPNSSCMFAGVPKKELSYIHMGKKRSPSTAPHADGRPTYNGLRPGSPRGSLRHC